MNLDGVMLRVLFVECPKLGSPCWIWTKAKDKDGYGKMKAGGKSKRVHRFVWEQNEGPITDGLTLDHLCFVKACCNPRHLEPVPGPVNTARSYVGYVRVTHCPKGHQYTPENTKVSMVGKGRYLSRACRHCLRVKAKAYYRNKKANSCQTPPP